MKKIFAWICLMTVAIFCLTGCGGQNTPKGEKAETSKLKVVTTIFPVYDWTKAVIGDSPVELSMLLDKGVDLHSYQPTAQDIMKLSSADVFIYVGGESDEWIKDALKEATNNNMVVVNLMEALGDRVKHEEQVEGMEPHHHDHGHDEHDKEHGHDHEKDHNHDKNHDHDKDNGHEEHDHKDHEEHKEHGHEEHAHNEPGHKAEYDEHIWLSLKNAQILVDAIENAMARADATHAETYRKNADAYKKKLEDLDGKYQAAISAAPCKTLLFGDRFPFRYLVNDYNLNYYAAFSGCSAESEASFETIAFLAGKTDELKLPAVMTIEGRNHKIAETVVQNTATHKQKILTMDSMQSTTSKDVENGMSYLAVMEKNLEVLKEALQQ